MHYDLLERGFHPEFAGSVGSSWYDLKMLVAGFLRRPETEFYRAINPNWMWDTFETFMLAELAKHMSRLVYLSSSEERPDDWYPRTYDPPEPGEETGADDTSSVEAARRGGAELHNML